MTISVKEFDAHQFSKAGRREEGYSANEVNEFLDKVRDSLVKAERTETDYESLTTMLAKAEARVRELESAAPVSNSVVVPVDDESEAEEATSVLRNAKRVAAEVTLNAQTKATAIVEKANAAAESTRAEADEYSSHSRTEADEYVESVTNEADRNAAQVKQDAETQAEEIVQGAHAEKKDVLSTIDNLVAQRDDLSTRLTAFLTQELEVVKSHLGNDKKKV